MTMDRIGLVVCLLLVSVGAGCVFVDTPPGARELRLDFDGSGGVTNATLQIQGAVEIQFLGGPGQSRVFENVTVTLYQVDSTPMCTRHVGSISEDGERNVSISWPTSPRYVILDSTDFWQAPSSSADYYNVTEDGEFFAAGLVKSRDRFPVDATNKSEMACNE